MEFTVVKPFTDKREHKTIHVFNGLSALLIHDPEMSMEPYTETTRDKHGRFMKKAAAAMCVNIGSLSDPWDTPGLAHFLEHMLFYGNTKYPNENEFSSFLAEHGGFTNAETSKEHTLYYFQVNSLFLKPALERFSHFFTSDPLMKENAITNEVQSVDSEFANMLQSDLRRLEHMKSVTANPNHPYSKFQCGNAKSLAEAINKCEDIREKLIQFYKQYYSANRMKLVVLGGESLDTLKQWVLEFFKDIPEGDTNPPKYMWNGSLWSTGKIHRMESVENTDKLQLSWTLPVLDSEYVKKENNYILYLIRREAQVNLLNYLRLKGWATKLDVFTTDTNIHGWILIVTIVLTSRGKKKPQVLDIISIFFEFIKMLKENKPQKWIYDELRAINLLDFKFAEEYMKEGTVSKYVQKLAKNMHLYPEHHVLYGEYAHEQWDPVLIDDILSCVTPTFMRIDVLSTSFDRNAPGVFYEPWSGIPYGISNVPENFLNLWKNPPCIRPELFQIPVVNEFISMDLRVHDALNNADAFPTLVEDETLCKVWYKFDQIFQTPISSSLTCEGERIELKLQGYNGKLYELAQKISISFKTLVVQKNHFQVVKEELAQNYFKTRKNKEHAYLLHLTWEDAKFTIPNFFKKVYIEALCHGNLTQNEALKIVGRFKNVVEDSCILPNLSKPLIPLLTLTPNADNIFNEVEKNINIKTSIIKKVFNICHVLGAETSREQALTHLFKEVVQEPFKNQLRFIEQLGYFMQCGTFCRSRALCIIFSISSPKYSPTYIRKRLDTFLYDKLQEYLNKMSDEVFQHFKWNSIASKKKKPNSMINQTNHYWKQILDESYLFDLHELEAQALMDIEKNDLVEWYNNYIRPGGLMRRSMCFQVWGGKFKEDGITQPRVHIHNIVQENFL